MNFNKFDFAHLLAHQSYTMIYHKQVHSSVIRGMPYDPIMILLGLEYEF